MSFVCTLRPLAALCTLLFVGLAKAAPPPDLMISEYIEGASFNKAIEIYNGTGSSVDLSAGQYRLELHVNGAAAASQSVALSGSLGDGVALVLCHSSAAADILLSCNVQNSSVINHNGDDAFVLRRNSTAIGVGDIVDSFGANTGDPGTGWGTGAFTTNDHTLRRQATICTGDTNIGDAFDPSLEWDTFAVGTHAGLGAHSLSCVDQSPEVDSTSPADSATGVALNASIDVTFSEAVAVTDPWFTISCATSGAHTAAVTGGPTTFTLNPDADFVNSELCTVTIDDLQVTDQDADDPPDNMAADHVFSFTTVGLLPSLSVTDVSQSEGDAGTTIFSFEVNLSAPAGGGGVTFDIGTSDSSATDADNDYEPNSLTGQTIASGNQTYQFDVTVNGDFTVEPDELFTVDVSNVSNATVADGSGTGTIQNDDAPIVAIHDIQGAGAFSPLDDLPGDNSPDPDTIKVVGAVVTAVTRVAAVDGSPADQNGFFMQAADADADANALTSEGILVFTSSDPILNVGDVVTVVGGVNERFRQTQINAASVTVTATGAALPTAVEFSATSGIPSDDPASLSCPGTGPGGTNDDDTNFECFEGMLVTMPDAIVSASNQRRGTDLFAEAYVSPNAVRSRREAGLLFGLTPGAGNSASPLWDGNPEVLEIDFDEAGLATDTELTAGSTFSATGVIGFSFGDYEFYPTTYTPDFTQIVPEAITATVAGNEMTIGSFNMQHLCDDPVDDGCVRDTPTFGAGAFNYVDKLRKVSAYVRTVLNSPDVLGVQEVDELSTLNDLAARIVTDGGPSYQALLLEGDDVGGIDVGYLLRTDRISGASVQQFFKGDTWPDPQGVQILHDRPPLLLRATFDGPNGPYPFAALNNHTKSIGNVDDETPAGERDRAKRFRQARDIATLVQQFQTATGPFAGQGTDTVPLILVGDYNAFEYTDGHVDVVGLIAGAYDDAENECNATLSGGAGVETCNIGANIVDPPLFIAALAVTESERMSYQFANDFGEVLGYGTNNPDREVPAGQVIDHVLLSRSAQGFYLNTDYGIGNNAAATETNRQQPPAEPALANAVRASDHDGVVAYLDFNCTANATLNPDGDLVCGMLDNCPNVANNDQADGDGDGIGNACDVNNVPTISAIADQASLEDGAPQVAFTIGDLETALTCGPGGSVSATSTNTTLLPVANIVFSGTAPNCVATLNTAANLSGGATVTLTVTDGAANTSEAFLLTVTAVNDAPSFTAGANQTVAEDAGAQTVPGWATAISAGPTNESSQTLGFNVTGNTNPGLFAVAPSVSAGGVLTYTPAANASGTATISLTVSDNGGTANGGVDTSAAVQFTIEVTAVADAPTISALADQSTAEDTAEIVTFAINDVDSSLSCSAANLSATSGNATVVPAANIVFSGTPPNCTATITPAANQTGTSLITITVTDGALTDSDDFVLTVGSDDDAPTLAAIADVTTTESTAAQAALLVADSDSTLTCSAANLGAASDNTALLPVTNVVFSGTVPNCIATLTPSANVTGNAVVTISLTDGSSTVNRSFLFTVTENDADNDGVVDATDNCPTTANPGQENSDGDTLGDACDPVNDPVRIFFDGFED